MAIENICKNPYLAKNYLNKKNPAQPRYTKLPNLMELEKMEIVKYSYCSIKLLIQKIYDFYTLAFEKNL